MSAMKAVHVVEAALFSAGGPIAVQDIMNQSGLGNSAVESALKTLVKEYGARDTVLEVGKAGTKWAMQVRSRASDEAAKFAPMEIPKKTLKTLALIGYHQPMKQSELKEMIGSKVYDHVAELKERGLVKSRKDGVTKTLSTTALFPEYFGIDATDQFEVRTAMAKLVGLPAPEKVKRPDDSQLSGFDTLLAAAEEHGTAENPPSALPDLPEAPEVAEDPQNA
jgi:segregation and condensation protein B